MKITTYALTTAQPNVDFRAAVVADLHDRRYDHILACLQAISPDCIFIPGDLTETLEDPYTPQITRPGLDFLTKAVAIAPTFYAFGNHESGAQHKNLRRAKRHALDRSKKGRVDPTWKTHIRKTGAVLLDEDFITWQGMHIGGLGSGLLNPDRAPDWAWVKNFASQDGYKILLCHHPEYFDRYLRDLDIDLFVSGHAHGGQWKLFGQSVYAPDQALFPRYASGLHEGRLVISCGVANTVSPIPRLFNPCEVVVVEVHSQKSPTE